MLIPPPSSHACKSRQHAAAIGAHASSCEGKGRPATAQSLAHLARLVLHLCLLPLIIMLVGCSKHDTPRADGKIVLRVGYFPNITHAQGIIGSTLTAAGKGWFEERLGPGVEVQWFAYNAGPSAMEALFSGSLDLTYVGPNPAINAYIRARGEEIRILAGAANGGAALLVRPGSGITEPADFKGRQIATPQFGNTQDIAARVWLKAHGFNITQNGGDVFVVPTANPDQLALFQQGKIDAVWTVEPWVSRIEREAGGKIFVEQDDAITTVLVASARALKSRPELVERFVQAHRELTDWINAHPDDAQLLVQRGITATVKRELPLDLVQSSWRRLHFTSAVDHTAIEKMVADARALGFIRADTPLDRLFADHTALASIAGNSVGDEKQEKTSQENGHP